MRITRGSNFHDEEQQLGAQSGVKQGSLKRRGSGFVSTVTPLSSLPVYPRVLEESLFSMTIEFRCAKVRRNRSREIDSRPISNLLPPPSLRRNLQIPRVFPLPSPLLCVLRYQGGSGVLGVSQKSLSFSARPTQGKRLSLEERHSRKAVR